MKKIADRLLSLSSLPYIAFVSFFMGTLLISSQAVSFFGGFGGKESRYYQRIGKLQQLQMAGNYGKLVKEYLKDLEKFEKEGNRYRQVEAATNLSNVYVNNLKDYSKTIEYGELASKLIEAAETAGIENEPDEHFFFVSAKEMEKRYQLSAKNQNKYGYGAGMPPTPLEKYGDQWVEKTKLEYYNTKKSAVKMSLHQAYKAIGDTQKANLYLKNFQKDEQVQENTKKYTGGYTDVMKRMNEQSARGDLEGLRNSIKEYVEISKKKQMESYKRYGNVQVDTSYLDMANNNMACNLAYTYGLYQDAYDYAVKALEGYQNHVKKMQGHASQALFSWTRKSIMTQQTSPLSGQVNKNNFIAGASLNKLGRYEEAVPYLKKTYEQKVTGYGYGADEMEALYELAYAYEKLGKLPEAIEAHAELIDFFEGIRAKMTKDVHKIGFMSAKHEIYTKMIELLFKQGRVSEALEYAERARGRTFADLLAGKAIHPKNKETRKLIAKKNSIESNLLTTQQQGAGQGERGIEIVQQEMDSVLKEIETQDAEFLSLTVAKTLTAKEIQSLLDKDTALLAYYLSDDDITIWVVTQDDIVAEKVDVPLWMLAGKVVQFREDITSPEKKKDGSGIFANKSKVRLELAPSKFKKGDRFAVRAYAKNNLSLYLSLDETVYNVDNWGTPIKEMLEKVIPAGQEKLIYDLPNYFNMEITAGRHQIVLKTDQGELYSNILEVETDAAGAVTVKDLGYIQTAKSKAEGQNKFADLTLYDLLIKSVKPYLTKRRIGIIPHGILHYLPFAALKHEDRYLVFDYALFYLPSATVYKFCKQKEKGFTGAVLALGNPDLNDPRLDIPFAQNEVGKISSLYPDSKILTKKQATESAIKSEAGSYNVLHFATHGIFDADQPLNSALLLSACEKDDGKLTVSEIFDLDLNAAMVTLSACQSGMSKIKAGDEMTGLPRAFIYAGASTVIASLWNVNDESTSILMEKYYNNLKDINKPDALRSAQLELLNNQKYNEPYYWAAFTLTGD